MSKKQRLIDVGKRIAEIKKLYCDGCDNYGGAKCRACWVDDAMCLIDDATPVDAMEVVHAEWLDIVFDPMWRSMSATCSRCMVRGGVRVKRNECGFAVPDSDYCPHCGAKMDGDADA